MIQLFLLLSLCFNITHASVIAIADNCDECENSSVISYVLEKVDTNTPSDLCTMHHLFHFMAIINHSNIIFDTTTQKDNFTEKLTRHTPPFQETSIKPPIA